MRVVGGSARGRPLRAPTGRSTRPTSDRVRESIFNILASLGAFEGSDGDGALVVDLFAGSGALGIEALSRGAGSAVFVDADPSAVAVIEANLSALGLSGPARRVVRGDAVAWVAGAGVAALAEADVVLADPPYAFDDWARFLADLARSRFSGLAVLEAGAEIETPADWNALRVRRYGTTVVHLLRPAVVAGAAVDPKGGV
jgi:16S rRNA (guanine966-N2)-methyltransferase